jgi:hypothetical protein
MVQTRSHASLRVSDLDKGKDKGKGKGKGRVDLAFLRSHHGNRRQMRLPVRSLTATGRLGFCQNAYILCS